MNKDNAKEFLPLVQALADGKTLQYEDHLGRWRDCDEVTFCSNSDKYRIKPEPREWFANLHPDDSGTIHTTESAANYKTQMENMTKRVRVREILD